MKKIIVRLCLVFFVFFSVSGCVPLIIGGAVGALGGYAVSKDTVQGDTDKPYESLWSSAGSVSRMRGIVKKEDPNRGYIELDTENSHVWIRLVRLTQATTRVRVSARKYHLPDLELSQDMFVKIMENAR
ncbi:MAG: DUF3568 family protein [Candidatus Omnitrophica bacterium]|nr:DUF3568 family protein [Candidatus Omnitrophota bacterium]